MLNPFIKNYKTFLLFFTVWQMIAVIQVLVLRFFLYYELKFAIADGLIFNNLYMLIALSIWYMANYVSFENYSPVLVISNHLGAALITSGLWVFLGYIVLTGIFPDYKSLLDENIFGRFFIGIFYYAILASLYYVIIYYANFQKKTLRESQLNSLIKEAELKTLRYQINPHFIFNSLNSISSLTVSNPERAQDMTIKLSAFLRNTLSKNEKQKIPLSEEINSIRLYIDIEKVRFEDRFDYTEKIEENTLQIPIPGMILQPLIENAIKHGVYESIEKVNIRVESSISNGYLQIAVQNNFDPRITAHKGTGIGLSNIADRLKLIYKQDNLMNYGSDGDIFTAKLFIPIEPEKI